MVATWTAVLLCWFQNSQRTRVIAIRMGRRRPAGYLAAGLATGIGAVLAWALTRSMVTIL